MTRIQEKFTINVANQTVLITHSGHKFLCDQKNAKKEIKEAIKFSIEKDGNTDGFMPYDNFDCSVKWKII